MKTYNDAVKYLEYIGGIGSDSDVKNGMIAYRCHFCKDDTSRIDIGNKGYLAKCNKCGIAVNINFNTKIITSYTMPLGDDWYVTSAKQTYISKFINGNPGPNPHMTKYNKKHVIASKQVEPVEALALWISLIWKP